MDADGPPLRLRAPMQRANGEAAVSFLDQKLDDLRQRGCLKVMLPRNHAAVPDVVLINTAGGVTAGDRLRSHLTVGDHSAARFASQTAERFYRASDHSEPGQVSAAITVGQNASAHWLPQESIVFDGSRTARETRFEVSNSATLVTVDAWVFGRVAMNEAVSHVSLTDTRQLYIDGRLRLFDRLNFQHGQRLSAPFVLGDAKAIASVWIYGQHVTERLDEARELADGTGLFSTLNGCLVGRFLDADPRMLRLHLTRWLGAFTRQELPRVWTM